MRTKAQAVTEKTKALDVSHEPKQPSEEIMERRDFIRLSIATAAATTVAAPQALAITTHNTEVVVSDIYYTKASPGRWAEKIATHSPNIEASKAGANTTVKVTTPHEMKGYEHYIVKHVLLDKNYKFLAEHMFNPLEDKVPVSEFKLESYSGTVHALSMCNKHDVWLSSAEI
jgi:superoxide reductase